MLLPMLSNRFMAPTLADPFVALRRDLDRLFETASSGNGRNGVTWAPPMDVVEQNGEIHCSLELPGLTPEDVSITAENGVLTISGEKKLQHEVKEGNGAHIIERRYGRFERSLLLPDTVDADKVTAHFDNGVLTVVLPKAAEARARRIEIRTGTNGRQVESAKGGRKVA